MKLGGLQQLMRSIDLPNGVKLKVASIFGQDYVDIYVPPELQKPMIDAEEVQYVEKVETEYDAQKINEFVEKNFEDTVRTTSYFTLELTKVIQPPRPTPIVRAAGWNSGSNRAFLWGSDIGLRTLPLRANQVESYAAGISADGNKVFGWIIDSRYSQKLPTKWASYSSSPVGPPSGSSYIADQESDNGDEISVASGSIGGGYMYWNGQDGAAMYAGRKGTYNKLSQAPYGTATSWDDNKFAVYPIGGERLILDISVRWPAFATGTKNAVIFIQPLPPKQTSTIVISG